MTAQEAFSVSRQAADPRADGGTRLVHVSAQQIVIERIIQGVRMKVAVPVATYGDLVLSVRPTSATATLRLRHDDTDLDVDLDMGPAIDTAYKAKAWGALFGKAIVIEEACVAIRQPFARERNRVRKTRRSSFARRRKVGIAARLDISYAGEREIIART